MAATAAISALSGLNDDGTRSQSGSGDGSSQPRSKRVKTGSAVAVVKGSITIENPAPIDNLPYEIRQLIISCFEDDVYTLLNLLLVSKVWYVTLMHGRQAEEDWHKRCLRMAPHLKRKKAGLKTWHTNFIDLLHNNCMGCHHNYGDYAVGAYLLYGFTFLKICHQCWQVSEPLMKYITEEQAEARCGEVSDVILRHVPRLPYGWNPDNPRFWSLAHMLEAAVDQAVIRRQKEDQLFANLTSNCPSEQYSTLQLAIAHCRDEQLPRCSALNEAVKGLREAESPESTHFDTILTIFESLINVVSARDAFLAEHDIEEESARPTFGDCFDRNSSDETWIDALVLKKTDVQQYLQAVLQSKKLLDEAELAHRLCYLEDLQMEKQAEQGERERREWPYEEQYCIFSDCDTIATSCCSHICCGSHCPGPCIRHDKPYPVPLTTGPEAIKEQEQQEQSTGTPHTIDAHEQQVAGA